jgi:hypothetical protein
MDRLKDGWNDGWMDGTMNGMMDGTMDGTMLISDPDPNLYLACFQKAF